MRCEIKLKNRYCCVSVVMRPAGYVVSPHVAHRAIWVWDPWHRAFTEWYASTSCVFAWLRNCMLT